MYRTLLGSELRSRKKKSLAKIIITKNKKILVFLLDKKIRINILGIPTFPINLLIHLLDIKIHLFLSSSFLPSYLPFLPFHFHHQNTVPSTTMSSTLKPEHSFSCLQPSQQLLLTRFSAVTSRTFHTWPLHFCSLIVDA